MAQKLTNAHLVHVRRCGGSGRMSSLIHTFTTLLSLDGIRTNSRNDRADIGPEVLVRFNQQAEKHDGRKLWEPSLSSLQLGDKPVQA
jgi:hypothetical protein